MVHGIGIGDGGCGSYVALVWYWYGANVVLVFNGDCNFMKLQRGSRVGAAKVFFYFDHPPATQWGWG